MVSSFISRLVILVFGTLYPAYASYKAVRTKNVKEYVKWMMYWIVFALFTCAETFTDLFFSFWFPFYYEIKIITVIYLLSPATKGSSILYRKFVHPVLIKREQEIDEYIAKAKEQGYHTMLNLGSKGVTYATSLIMQTAIKGGGGLVNQLRRSYSLSDLNEEQGSRRKNGECADDRDGPYVEDHGLIKRQFVQSPHGIPPAELYFSEVDYCQRSIEEDYRQIPSEEISSGYSSADHLYYGMQRARGDHLVRTASLGPSSRVRTRAATKNGLPKRASLLEGGSSWSALEPLESQNETDMHLYFPLAHSASLPFPPPQHLFIPEYQYMSRNLTQNHMFTFINKAQYAQSDEIANYEKNLDADESENSRNSTIITEENSEDPGSQTKNESFVPAVSDFIRNSVTNEEMKIEDFKASTFINEKTEKDILRSETENENSKMNSKKCLEEKEKVLSERLGEHNKKPAPFPPTEEQNSKITLNTTAEDKEIALFTSNVSPKSDEMHSSCSIVLSVKKSSLDYDFETRPLENNLLEGPKKSKVKTKKDSKPKKLHMPKMTFSFWHAKGGKQTSASESSSVASVDISASKSDNKNNLENVIPLKGNVDTCDGSDLKK